MPEQVIEQEEQKLVDEVFELYFNLKTDIPDSGLKFDYKNFRDVSICVNSRINKRGDNNGLLFDFRKLNRGVDEDLKASDIVGIVKKIKVMKKLDLTILNQQVLIKMVTTMVLK